MTTTKSLRRILKDDNNLFCARRVEFKQLPDEADESGIRIYGSNQCAVLQLRAIGPIDDRGRGVARRMIATASFLDRAECTAIINRLTEIRETLPE